MAVVLDATRGRMKSACPTDDPAAAAVPTTRTRRHSAGATPNAAARLVHQQSLPARTK